MSEGKTLFICYHGSVCRKQKWIHLYAIGESAAEIEGVETIPEFSCAKKLSLWLPVGWIYKVKAEFKDGTIEYERNSSSFVGKAENVETLVAVAKANEMTRNSEKAAAAPWVDSMKPAREAYRRASGASKNMVLAQVVRYVTKGK